MPVFQISEAAHLLGVSDDTVRRWADVGHLHAVQQPSGRLGIEGEELARFAVTRAEDPGSPPPIVGESSRNRFTGIVTRVVRDEVMAQVDLQAGPFRVVSLMSREAADELGLAPGVLAVAAVKSTNVVIELARQPQIAPTTR
jgi:molybdopterin-binding protein